MKPTLVLLLIGLGLGTASARDFGRKSTVVTARGNATRSVCGSIASGAASRSAVTTGAQGRTVATAKQVTRNADGTGRNSAGSVTGPQGQTATSSGSVTRIDGVRTAVRSVTGPNGQTKSVTNTTSK